MTTETITDYETTEVEREVTYSDLSGREIPDGDEISLPVNPKPDTQDLRHRIKQAIIDQGKKENYANALADLVVENMDSPRAVCEGRIHLHIDELAELNGIDSDDIDADTELPEWYVKKESPEVVIRPWIGSADIGPASWWFGMILCGLNVAWVLTAFHLWPKPVGDMVTVLVLLSSLLSFIGFWALLEVRNNDCW